MQCNFLKLNCEKSDMLLIGPKSLTKNNNNFSLTIDYSTLSPSPHIHNLGVTVYSNHTFETHLNHIAKHSIHPSLSIFAAETLIHAFISSRLNYCNSILYGTSSKLNNLEYIQNSADHINPACRTSICSLCVNKYILKYFS